MPSIDAKVAARDPAAWDRYAARTSILPFGAIAAGRNRLALGEIGWLPPALGFALWLGLLVLHPHDLRRAGRRPPLTGPPLDRRRPRGHCCAARNRGEQAGMQERLTDADAAETPRAAAARLTQSPLFQRTVTALILLNAVTLGLETSAAVTERAGAALQMLDRALLWIFTAELAIRIYAFRGRFFRDPWGVFDLLVVGIAWLPATDALSVLRALRVLRVLRLVSVVPSLRVVVEAMLAALPGMGSIVALMLLIFYVAAVMATKLYGGVAPEKFGNLGASFFTLFQLMTLEDWADGIVNPVLEQRPWAGLFFFPFILVATFVVLNLFIGVIVESIQSLREEREAAGMAEAREEAHADAAVLLREVRALREELAALRAEKGSGGADGARHRPLAHSPARVAGCVRINGEEQP